MSTQAEFLYRPQAMCTDCCDTELHSILDSTAFLFYARDGKLYPKCAGEESAFLLCAITL